MTIKVKFFARLREDAGISETDVPFRAGMSASEAWQAAGARGSAPSSVLVAVNREYARGEVSLQDGDEVAFFPPVTGG